MLPQRFGKSPEKEEEEKKLTQEENHRLHFSLFS